MKRMIAISLAATLLLTGCGQVNENIGADISDNELQSDMNYSSTIDDGSLTNKNEDDIDINVVFKGNPVDVSNSRDSFINSVEDITTANCIVGLELQEALNEYKINQYSTEGGSVQIQYSTPQIFELKGLDNTKSLEISKIYLLIDTEDNRSLIGIVCGTDAKVYHMSNESVEVMVKYLTGNTSTSSENTNNSQEDTFEDIGEAYFKEPEPENIVYDEEHGLSYVKNQLLISISPDTERSKVVEMLSTGDYGEVQIVGEIALTGDYQVEFSEDKSLSELQEVADYYMIFPFVENVTLNIISETAPAESEVSEVEDGWIAKLNGGSGEITYHTYVYEAENGYKYINTTSTTVSYGSPQWTERVIDSGTVSTKEEIVQIAKDNGSKQYVTFPDDKETYKISDFLNMD